VRDKHFRERLVAEPIRGPRVARDADGAEAAALLEDGHQVGHQVLLGSAEVEADVVGGFRQRWRSAYCLHLNAGLNDPRGRARSLSSLRRRRIT